MNTIQENANAQPKKIFKLLANVNKNRYKFFVFGLKCKRF